MSNETLSAYGWESEAPMSCGYIAPTVLQLLHDLGSRRVLDLGCGNGQLCGQLARAGYDVVGVERDAEGVRIARQSSPQIRFHNAGVYDDPLALLEEEGGRKFDTVVSTEVIEHLYSPHCLPAFAHRLLDSNGHLIISTPYHGYLKNLALAACGAWDRHLNPLWHHGHIKFWSRPTLSRLLTEARFEVTRFAGVGRYPYLWKSMILVARKI